jgi:hypothetical protein
MDPNQPFQEGIPAAIRETPTAQSPIPAATPTGAQTEFEVKPSLWLQQFWVNVKYSLAQLSSYIFVLALAAPAIEEIVPTLPLGPHGEHWLQIGLGFLGIVAATLPKKEKS